MVRRSFLATSVLLMSVVAISPLDLLAQAPRGWKLRIDRSTSAADPDAAGSIKFTATPTGFHAVNPQAAVYWNPANTATGNYTLKGSFTLVTPSNHTNYYGLVFGGTALEGAQQSYTYFTVAQDGSWLIKHREGEAATNLAPRGSNAAVKRPDASGKSINVLEVRVTGDKLDYVVNGTIVHSATKTGAPATDGIYGFRVNHQLEVQVDGLAVMK